MSTRRITTVLLPILMLLAVYCYWPGIDGPLLLDDIPNIQQNAGIRISSLDGQSLASVVNSTRDLQPDRHPWFNRPISYLSLALNYCFFGESVKALKITNVFLHLLTGIAVYFFVLKLMSVFALTSTRIAPNSSFDYLIPMLTTAFWLLHPLWASTVLYVIQRMAILSALFTLIGCVFYLHYRLQLMMTGKGMIVGTVSVAFFTLLAFLAKENGALLPVFCLVMELVCFRFKLPGNICGWQRGVYTALILLPTATLLVFLCYQFFIYYGVNLEFRSFSVVERLLTESRILWFYLVWLIVPDTSQYVFFHDSVVLSTSVVSPLSTLIAIIAWGVLLAGVTLCLFENKYNLLSFAVLWFIAGHLLESTTIPLELVFEHRNYLASLGPLFAVVIVLVWLLSHVKSRLWVSWFVLFSLLCILPATLLNESASHWSSYEKLSAHLLKINPQSPRAWAKQADTLFKAGQIDDALDALDRAYVLSDKSVGYALAMTVAYCHQKKQIPFELLKKIEDSMTQPEFTAFSGSQFISLTHQCSSARYDRVLWPIYRIATTKTSIATNAFYMLALATYRLGDFESAFDAIGEVIERDPSSQAPNALARKISIALETSKVHEKVHEKVHKAPSATGSD